MSDAGDMGDFEEILDDESIDAMMDEMSSPDEESDEEETEKRPRRRSRPSLKTPVLSGKNMAATPPLPRIPAPNIEDDDETIDMEVSEAVVDAAKRTIGEGRPAASRAERDLAEKIANIKFDRVYHQAELSGDGFNVYRVEKLFEDEDIADLDRRARAAAVRMTLKSHDVDVEEVVDDVAERAEALERFRQRLGERVDRLEQVVTAENERLQNEIEEFANPRLARMEDNEKRLMAAHRAFEKWTAKMETELDRIAAVVEPWGDPLRATTKLHASSGGPAATRPQEENPDDEGPPTESTAPIPGVQPLDDATIEEPEASTEQSAVPATHGPPGLPVQESDARENGGVHPEPIPGGSETDGAVETPAAPSVETHLPAEHIEAPPGQEEVATGEFDAIGYRLRVPRTAVQWLTTLLALALYPISSMLLMAQLSADIKGPFAIAVAFGGPLLLAIVVSLTTRGRGWVFGFFNVLLFSGILAAGFAHYRPQQLVDELVRDPMIALEETGLVDTFDPVIRAVGEPYAQSLVNLGLATRPPEPDASTDAP